MKLNTIYKGEKLEARALMSKFDTKSTTDARARVILAGLFFSIFAVGLTIIALFVPQEYHLEGAEITLIFDMCVFGAYWIRKLPRTVDDRILTTAAFSGAVMFFLVTFLLFFPRE